MINPIMENLKKLIYSNKELMTILNIADSLNLNDCWLCAGCIRNFYWNQLSGNSDASINQTDVDIIFYDENISYNETLRIEEQLLVDYPKYHWEVKNQVYMHVHNPGAQKYKNSKDAISKFPETCTAIGVRIKNGQLDILAPHGLEDLANFIVRPTPFFLETNERKKIYTERLLKKQWQNTWPTIRYIVS